MKRLGLLFFSGLSHGTSAIPTVMNFTFKPGFGITRTSDGENCPDKSSTEVWFQTCLVYCLHTHKIKKVHTSCAHIGKSIRILVTLHLHSPKKKNETSMTPRSKIYNPILRSAIRISPFPILVPFCLSAVSLRSNHHSPPPSPGKKVLGSPSSRFASFFAHYV